MNKLLITLGFIGITFNVHAETKVAHSKDWMWTTAPVKGMYFAATINDARQFIGLYCDPEIEGENCIYRMRLGTRCKAGDTYHALLTSGLGSAHLDLTCNEDNVVDIAPFKTIDEVLRGKGVVGIAVPEADGSFAVSRFSLKGSTAAIAAIANMSTTTREPAPKPEASSEAAFIRM